MAAKNTAPDTLSLRGELTVRTIADAHQKLTDAYAKSPTIGLDLSDVGDADLTLVQLIEAVRHSASKDGKKIRITRAPASAVFEILERGGFLANPEDILFWKNAAP